MHHHCHTQESNLHLVLVDESLIRPHELNCQNWDVCSHSSCPREEDRVAAASQLYQPICMIPASAIVTKNSCCKALIHGWILRACRRSAEITPASIVWNNANTDQFSQKQLILSVIRDIERPTEQRQ